MIAPYKSIYYESTLLYERFGNLVVYPNQEVYFYITDYTIPGIEQWRYSISNRMHIYDYVKQTFVTISMNTNYPSVNLYNALEQKTKTYLLHRLYMLVFCYFPGCEKFEVNHIDGDKFNCHPSNLEWMTHKDNMNHAFTYLMTSKLSDQDLISIIQMYNSKIPIRIIADKFNISTSYVMDIIKGKPNRDEAYRIKRAKEICPVIRTSQPKVLSDDKLAEIAIRYSNGEEYFELAQEYNLDRSYLTKSIKEYAKNHPEIKLRALKKFSPEIAEQVCIMFERDASLNIKKPYSSYLKELGLEVNEANRKALSNLYNGNTYTNISSKYNYR